MLANPSKSAMYVPAQCTEKRNSSSMQASTVSKSEQIPQCPSKHQGLERDVHHSAVHCQFRCLPFFPMSRAKKWMRMCSSGSTFIIQVQSKLPLYGSGNPGLVSSPPTPVMYSEPQDLFEGPNGFHPGSRMRQTCRTGLFRC